MNTPSEIEIAIANTVRAEARACRVNACRRAFLHTAIIVVHDIQVVARVYSDARRGVIFACRRSQGAISRLINAATVKLDHPIIARIDDPDVSAAVNGNAGGIVQRAARAIAVEVVIRGAVEAQSGGARGTKLHDTVIAGIDHIDIVACIDGDAGRVAEIEAKIGRN